MPFDMIIWMEYRFKQNQTRANNGKKKKTSEWNDRNWHHQMAKLYFENKTQWLVFVAKRRSSVQNVNKIYYSQCVCTYDQKKTNVFIFACFACKFAWDFSINQPKRNSIIYHLILVCLYVSETYIRIEEYSSS